MAGQVWRYALSADCYAIACRVIGASLIVEIKDMGEQNRRLKKMYAEERLKAELRQEALEGKL
jgi:hypothetical protein